MATVSFVSKTPAGGLGNFNYKYSCKCASGEDKGEVEVSSGNDNTAKLLAEQECNEKCGEG